MSFRSPLISNRLLAEIPATSARRFELVSLTLRQTLYEAGGLIEHAYFPQSGMISLVSTLDDGSQAEVGIVGKEGMLGTGLLCGAATSFIEAMVQMPGSALRIGAAELRDELETNPILHALLLRYTEAALNQVMQTAACNGRHALEQRLARWLLMAHDRAGRDTLPLTQEFIAMMLGVHRPSVTVTAGLLQRAGLIRYNAGRVTVLDRNGLQAAACECYEAVHARFATLLGTIGS